MREAAKVYDFDEHLSLSTEHAGTISDELARKIAVAGHADHCIERLNELATMGVDSITHSLLSKGREERLRTLGTSVIPYVK